MMLISCFLSVPLGFYGITGYLLNKPSSSHRRSFSLALLRAYMFSLNYFKRSVLNVIGSFSVLYFEHISALFISKKYRGQTPWPVSAV